MTSAKRNNICGIASGVLLQCHMCQNLTYRWQSHYWNLQLLNRCQRIGSASSCAYLNLARDGRLRVKVLGAGDKGGASVAWAAVRAPQDARKPELGAAEPS